MLVLPRSLFGLPDKASLGPAFGVPCLKCSPALQKRPFCSSGPILNATSSENFLLTVLSEEAVPTHISHSLEAYVLRAVNPTATASTCSQGVCVLLPSVEAPGGGGVVSVFISATASAWPVGPQYKFMK